MTIVDLVVFVFEFLLIGVIMWFLPIMKGQDSFFGIPVSREFYRSRQARTYLRHYRMVTGFLVGAPLGYVLTAAHAGALTAEMLLGLILVAALGPIVPLVVYWRAVRPHEVAQPAAQVPLAGEQRSKWAYVTPWVEAVLLAGLVVAGALALWQYPQLPERIPTHWNAAGQADGWHPKSPWPLISILLMMGFMHVLLLWLLVGMAQVRVRLPAERTEEYRAARERYMCMWVNFTNAMRFTIFLIFFGIVWASLFGIESQARGGVPPGMVLVFVGTVGLFASVAWLLVKALRLRAKMREIAGPGTMESVAPTEGWLGGMIYCNRSDPAVWVEKRIGVGWTLNFAHPVSWLFIMFAIAVPIGIALVALLGVGQ
jgi:uncharacterized membrane protein